MRAKAAGPFQGPGAREAGRRTAGFNFVSRLVYGGANAARSEPAGNDGGMGDDIVQRSILLGLCAAAGALAAALGRPGRRDEPGRQHPGDPTAGQERRQDQDARRRHLSDGAADASTHAGTWVEKGAQLCFNQKTPPLAPDAPPQFCDVGMTRP